MDKTIVQAVLESDLVPGEKSHSRLWQVAQEVIGAGSDTTAYVLTITHFHLLDNPHILQTLRAELVRAMPDKRQPVKLSVVEQLPYLVSQILDL